jgi:hypothetical protein
LLVPISVSTLSRRARSLEQGDRQTLETLGLEWLAGRFHSTCFSYSLHLWRRHWYNMDLLRLFIYITTSGSPRNASSPADTPALSICLAPSGLGRHFSLSTPLPASATCMCCSHVAQSAATSQTRCTQYSRRFWLACSCRVAVCTLLR